MDYLTAWHDVKIRQLFTVTELTKLGLLNFLSINKRFYI